MTLFFCTKQNFSTVFTVTMGFQELLCWIGVVTWWGNLMEKRLYEFAGIRKSLFNSFSSIYCFPLARYYSIWRTNMLQIGYLHWCVKLTWCYSSYIIDQAPINYTRRSFTRWTRHNHHLTRALLFNQTFKIAIQLSFLTANKKLMKYIQQIQWKYQKNPKLIRWKWAILCL